MYDEKDFELLFSDRVPLDRFERNLDEDNGAQGEEIQEMSDYSETIRQEAEIKKKLQVAPINEEDEIVLIKGPTVEEKEDWVERDSDGVWDPRKKKNKRKEVLIENDDEGFIKFRKLP